MITLRPYQTEGLDRRRKPNSPKQIAIKNGLIHFQGSHCKRNHSGLRYTKGGQCVECIELARGITIETRGKSKANIVLSAEALSKGLTTYIPEKACKAGHLLRFIASNNCVECDKAMSQKHTIARKYSRITKLYNLSKEQYLKLVQDQNSSCKLCRKCEEDHFRLHIDHCHETNKVRGLLCGKCNQGIGLLNHDPDLIRKAALYCEAV